MAPMLVLEGRIELPIAAFCSAKLDR